ncbi:probable proline--tRNA ligase, mitochondrial [Acyrthosiphon pisum]|uniref:Probable proline--tRNA ligase, mitochondrial n=1 Tax=Acyrthosiphon pisum TaxID=7029 RepID=A0A8R1W4E8_ACYPI|nr:probable proline--tRNA ligase, mitochondrial [Acyrthosiphon pisum]|eukprot:XP_001946406.1 PREDICTED: probable proline--tRNA ligase, mitochondrial [Acyrthosiphon pisum]
MNSLKNMFRPTKPISKNVSFKPDELISNSQKLMLELGIIRQSANGLYHLLPLAQRSLDKLIFIINKNMMDIGAQKISMPVLIHSNLWKKTGRLNKNIEDLYLVNDRKSKEFLLSPTHEEVVTDLFSSDPKTYKQLPLMLYQVGTKFRDEIRPKLGIIRSKEFLMKDLYSFDRDQTSATFTYNKVCQAYEKIFKHIGVKFIRVEGASGMMGGNQSHEFHYPAEVGDDTLLQCKKCGFGMNKEMSPESVQCPKCSSTDIEFTKAIEVGHTFHLGTFYSSALSATYSDTDGTMKPPYMCSYGLGVSRIIGASVECLSTQDVIQWPRSISPFTICIIPAKEGSIEENASLNNVHSLYNHFTEIFGDDIIVDDRTHMTIGKRLIEAKKLGFPFVVVMGKKMNETPSLYELYEANTNKSEHYELSNLINYLKQQCLDKI